MPINFHPDTGMILMCNFDTGFRPPEMVKVRPVVVMSARRHNAATCLVVPLSTKKPEESQESCCYLMPAASLPTTLHHTACWAKGDMLTAVCLWRLDRVNLGRIGNTRTYGSPRIPERDLKAIRKAVLVAVGLGDLRASLDGPPPTVKSV